MAISNERAPGASGFAAFESDSTMDDDFADFFQVSEERFGPEDHIDFQELRLEPSDWQELYEAGIDYREGARIVMPELAEADDQEVEDVIAEMTAGMSEAEQAEFFKKLARAVGRGLKKVGRVVAPVLRVAAPVIGTALGGPLGGAVGALVGNTASGALGRGRRRRRRRVRPRRAIRARRRRPASRGNHRDFMARMLRLIQSGALQRALKSSLRGESHMHTPTGESMTVPAILVGLHGAIVESLYELQESGLELDYSSEGYSPSDFDSATEAFETLEALLEQSEGLA